MTDRLRPRAYDRRNRRGETVREIEAWLAEGAPDDDPPPFPDPLLEISQPERPGCEMERVAQRLGLEVADLPGWGTAVDADDVSY